MGHVAASGMGYAGPYSRIPEGRGHTGEEKIMGTVRSLDLIAGYGAYDLWELFEYGERVSCGNPRVFLHFLASPGTRGASVGSVVEGCGVSFRVEGPIGDDGEAGLLEYQLTAGEARDSFAEEELDLLISLIAIHGDRPEPGGAVSARVARALGVEG